MRARCNACDVEEAAQAPLQACWCCGGPTRPFPGNWPAGTTMASGPLSLEDLLAAP